MKSLFSKSIFIICFGMILSFTRCSSQPHPSESKLASTESSSKGKIFSVDEPVISNIPETDLSKNFSPTFIGKNREIKLSNLKKNLQSANFFIDDDIVFPSSKKNKFNNVKFHIVVECNEHDSQITFKKETILNYKNKIPLIELLPNEIFLNGNRWWLDEFKRSPICNFNFTAKNNSGDLHHFSLPQLAIHSFEDKRNLNLVSKKDYFPTMQMKQNEDNVPVLFKKMELYILIKNENTNIEELQLKCEAGADIRFPVTNNSFFDLEQYRDKWSSVVFETKNYQACRFIGYDAKKITAVSELFPLVLSPAEIDIEISQINQNMQLFTQAFKNNEIDSYMNNNLNKSTPLLFLKIKNNNTYPVHIWLPDTRLHVDYISFYNGINKKIYVSNPKTAGTFITKNMNNLGYFIHKRDGITFKLRNLKLSDEILQKEENEILLTIAPLSSESIEMLAHDIEYCFSRQNFQKKPVGFIFEGERPAFYYVLNNNNSNLARKTKIELVEWSKKRERNKLNKTPSPFFLSQLIFENQDQRTKHYFENTCENASLNKLDSYSQTSWEITKFRYNTTAIGGFTRSGESLQEKIEQFTKKQTPHVKTHRFNYPITRRGYHVP